MKDPSELYRVPYDEVLGKWMAFIAEDKNVTGAAYEYMKDSDWEFDQQSVIGS